MIDLDMDHDGVHWLRLDDHGARAQCTAHADGRTHREHTQHVQRTPEQNLAQHLAVKADLLRGASEWLYTWATVRPGVRGLMKAADQLGCCADTLDELADAVGPLHPADQPGNPQPTGGDQ
ncbi:MAG: hypothetical protein ACRCZP_11470 [Phycicoccus sp.]